MNNFEKWNKAFREQEMFEFNNNISALLWLKVRAICRGRLLGQFLMENGITLKTKKIKEKNVELFEILEKQDQEEAMNKLDSFLKHQENEWYRSMGVDENQLKEDLFKVDHYSWGGDQNNSLDKHLVSRYVKVISSYEKLLAKRGEIAENSWNYVQTSWYNNWTSYLIESQFKRHSKVISAVGEIKSVDFFIGKYPIDLKVTFFPNQYMDEKIKFKLGKSELSWLKTKGKELGITSDSGESESQQIYTLTEKLKIKHKDVIEKLNSKKSEAIREAQKHPAELMKWLYEHQGEMRFGAENRLFVILADSAEIRDSWKLKRVFEIISPQIDNYLNNFNDSSLKKIDFTFNGKDYSCLADVIFIVRD